MMKGGLGAVQSQRLTRTGALGLTATGEASAGLRGSNGAAAARGVAGNLGSQPHGPSVRPPVGVFPASAMPPIAAAHNHIGCDEVCDGRANYKRAVATRSRTCTPPPVLNDILPSTWLALSCSRQLPRQC
jgi:hypothetical protein